MLLKDYPIDHANLLNAYAILLGNTGANKEAKEVLLSGVDILDKAQDESTSALNIKAQSYNNAHASIASNFEEAETLNLKAIAALEELGTEPDALVQHILTLVLYTSKRVL